MGDNRKIENKQASELDLRCSTICTRAGVAALAVSLLAFSMIQPLEKANKLNALSQFVDHREKLKIAVDHLNQTQCLEGLKSCKAVTNSVQQSTVASLRTCSCSDRSESPPWEIAAIAEHLEYFGQGPLIEQASDFSYRYRIPIYEWVIKRDSSILKNIDGSDPLYKKVKDTSMTFLNLKVESFSAEELNRSLKLEDVQAISRFDARLDPVEIEDTVARNSVVALPWTINQIGAIPAGLIIESVLFMSMVYFWLFQREAQYSESFPATGTIFSVFMRGPIAGSVFILLVLVPVTAAVSIDFRLYPLKSFCFWLILILFFGISLHISWKTLINVIKGARLYFLIKG